MLRRFLAYLRITRPAPIVRTVTRADLAEFSEGWR